MDITIPLVVFSSTQNFDNIMQQSYYTAKRLPKSMHYIQKSIKDWIVKSLQESILLCDFSDFIEAFDCIDSFTIQPQSDYNMILDQISLW